MNKSEKARISVQKRWDKKKEENTNVLRTYYECNTIKESKEKESKEKELVASQPNEYQLSISYLKNIENEQIPDYAENFKNYTVYGMH